MGGKEKMSKLNIPTHRDDYRIAVIPGDGTGPEVINEGLKVLKAASQKFGFKYESNIFDFSGERYLRTGKTVDEKDIEELKKYNAIYLGAVGHPDVKPARAEIYRVILLKFLNISICVRSNSIIRHTVRSRTRSRRI